MTDRRYAEGLSEDTLKDGPSGTRPEDRPEVCPRMVRAIMFEVGFVMNLCFTLIFF